MTTSESLEADASGKFTERSARAKIPDREAPAAPYLAVSIAMATYNGATYLREQLDSLAAQELLPFEVVVTDDASSDDTLAILYEFAATAAFPVRVFSNPSRLGFAGNFLRAASLCRGDLVAFCDQDDIWLPGKLSTCVQRFSDPELCLCAHSGELTGDGSAPGTRFPDFRRTRTYKSLGIYPLAGCYGLVMVFRRSLLDIADPSLRPVIDEHTKLPCNHDQWVWFLATVFGKVTVLSDVLVLYRQHLTNACGAPTGASLRTVLAARDYTQRAFRELRSSKFLESLATVCAEEWRPRAFAGSKRMAQYGSINTLRTGIYKVDARLPTRARLYLAVFVRGGYFIGDAAAWLGVRAAAKDLVLGVFRLRLTRT